MNLRSVAGTKVAGAIALCLLAGLGWLLVLGPETAHVGEVQGRIVEARDQNDLLAVQLLGLKRQLAELDATRATAESLAKRFPPTADQPGLFEQVTAAAVAAGIGPKQVTALTPTPPSTGQVDPATGVQPEAATSTGLARQTVTVAVEGDYTAIRDLLGNLEGLDRSYLITGVTLATGSTEGTYTATIDGEMFVMPPAPEPDLGDLS